MVKGVHKKVIEVHQPDSAYFEKAIFYLRPGITQLPPELAQAAAREYLQELEPNPLPPFSVSYTHLTLPTTSRV